MPDALGKKKAALKDVRTAAKPKIELANGLSPPHPACLAVQYSHQMPRHLLGIAVALTLPYTEP
jgi:hypothetical protein